MTNQMVVIQIDKDQTKGLNKGAELMTFTVYQNNQTMRCFIQLVHYLNIKSVKEVIKLSKFSSSIYTFRANPSHFHMRKLLL